MLEKKKCRSTLLAHLSTKCEHLFEAALLRHQIVLAPFSSPPRQVRRVLLITLVLVCLYYLIGFACSHYFCS
uniref:Transmembrane protein n=1 Tax=Rhizophora mucronata TaxID=61149 RepID=A0A2P2NG88_RHIMU